jgi:hypothetical protein
MKACEVHPRTRHQRRQPREEVQRLEHHVRGTVTIGSLQRVPHLPPLRQRQPRLRHRRSCDVAAQPLHLVALIGPRRDPRVQREPGHPGDPVPRHRLLVRRRQRAQHERLLPALRTHCDPIGDRRAQQSVQRTGLALLPAQPRLFLGTLQQAPTLQVMPDARDDALEQRGELDGRRRRHGYEARPALAVSGVHAIQKEHVEVDVHVQRTAEALHQRHRPALGIRPRVTAAPDQPRLDRPHHQPQHRPHRRGLAGEQES